LSTKSEITRRPRLGSIDLLRGFFIFVMIVDHVARFPNVYDLLSGRDSLWFSAAEGFVTISGLLVGYIYTHKILIQPTLVVKRLYRRALVLYISVISLALFFMAYSHFILHEGNFVQGSNSLFGLLFQLATLQYSYGWAEFLTHYVIFLLLAPLGLYLIAKKHSILLLLLSCLVWAVNLWNSDGQTRYEFTASWQFLFFIGMVVGAHLLSVNAWVRSHISKLNIQRLKYILWGVALLLFILNSFLSYGINLISDLFPSISLFSETVHKIWTPLNENFFSWWTDKATAAPLRILFGVVMFWALFTFFNRFATQIHKYTNGVFLTLGRQPLFAYCFGAVAIFFTEKYIPSPSKPGLVFVANFLVTSGVLFITYSFTKLFTRYTSTKTLRSPEFRKSID
jgi:hypothetical protein